MKLTVFERITLLNVLGYFQGDFTTLKIVRELKESLSFTEEEHKALDLRIENGQAYWISEADEAKDIPVGDKAAEIIREQLTGLNERKMLTDDHYSLYVKFVEAN